MIDILVISLLSTLVTGGLGVGFILQAERAIVRGQVALLLKSKSYAVFSPPRSAINIKTSIESEISKIIRTDKGPRCIVDITPYNSGKSEGIKNTLNDLIDSGKIYGALYIDASRISSECPTEMMTDSATQLMTNTPTGHYSAWQEAWSPGLIDPDSPVTIWDILLDSSGKLSKEVPLVIVLDNVQNHRDRKRAGFFLDFVESLNNYSSRTRNVITLILTSKPETSRILVENGLAEKLPEIDPTESGPGPRSSS